MDIVYLSHSFYSKYPNCPELLQKENRPYVCIMVRVCGKTFGIPIRHHITHKYCFHTVGDCGLDYTKAVVVSDPSDIAADVPVIDTKEYRIIKVSEKNIISGFEKYIKTYQKACAYPENRNYDNIRNFSTLKYFDV